MTWVRIYVRMHEGGSVKQAIPDNSSALFTQVHFVRVSIAILYTAIPFLRFGLRARSLTSMHKSVTHQREGPFQERIVESPHVLSQWRPNARRC